MCGRSSAAARVKNFEEFAKRLLNDHPLLKMVKGWDTVTKQIVEGIIEVRVTLPAGAQIEAVVRKLTINTVRDGDGFVLAADVLANSLNYLFKHRQQAELYKPLNQPAAIVEHPIAGHLATFYDWGGGDLVGDRLYRHPKSRVP
jgi:hypothetical protein